MSLDVVSHGTQVTVQYNPLLALVPILPLCGAAVLATLIFSKGEASRIVSGWVATASSALAFYVTLTLFLQLPSEQHSGSTAFVYTFWNWINVGNFNASFALKFDRLAAVMTLVVTGVGSLIHLYAIGYMSHDESRPRFFCYLNLFLFAMLLLVLGDNLLLMFVGWEGVGLCSYLLIGFWYKEMPNAIAGQKAFIVNRIGDAGFILGIFTLFYLTGTINFDGLNSSLTQFGSGATILEVAAFLLFIGAVGKSAQIPLFVWLPDAMAGPTPVSALIHAATMVTAGIYMTTRLHVLFAAAPVTLTVISVVGALTALLAASIALVQNDIKKVLAYSTVSQLGYMFMALGAGAFSNGIYHVVTHAFFKACLFMGAGSVIVGCHHEQDMRHFGGLRKSMKFTFLTYFVATMAIAGLPPLSGFYSKDAILWTVFSNPGLPGTLMVAGYPLAKILWGVGMFTAFLTAFYMTRSLVLTFFGEYRGHEHPHESPWTMVLPLMVLMVLSACFGVMHYGEHMMHFLSSWTRADMLVGHEELAKNHTYHFLEMLSIGVAGGGVLASFCVYLFLPKLAESASRALPFLYKPMLNKWWIDELYQKMVVSPLRGLSQLLFEVIDRKLVDGTVGGTGIFVLAQGDILKRLHTGRIGFYALWMLLGGVTFWLFWILL